jgi:hypothetical protein
MTTLHSLDELAGLVRRHDDRELYVRWSRGPHLDAPPGRSARQTSRDALTGIELPGLSANPLRVEPWWDDRPLHLWLARRLHDYRHLRRLRGPGVRPWVLRGTELARGPDNEPLVRCRQPLAWVADSILTEARKLVEAQGSGEWGPLDRNPDA